MKGLGLINGCFIFGVLFTVLNLFTTGNSFGKGLTDNSQQKGFNRFIYPDRSERN